MKKLIIDSSSNIETKVGLDIDGKIILKIKNGKIKSQIVLRLIDRILKENKVKLNQIEEIEVNEGPGSFTGLRVGVAIANGLSFSLKIPVNGKKVGEFAIARYN